MQRAAVIRMTAHGMLHIGAKAGISDQTAPAVVALFHASIAQCTTHNAAMLTLYKRWAHFHRYAVENAVSLVDMRAMP